MRKYVKRKRKKEESESFFDEDSDKEQHDFGSEKCEGTQILSCSGDGRVGSQSSQLQR